MSDKIKLITLDNLGVFKENIEKEIDSGSGSTQVCDCVGNVGTYDTSTEIAEINGIKYHITGDATCEIVGFDSDNSNGNLTLGFIVVYGKYYAVTEVTDDGTTEFNNDETILTLNIVNEITLGKGSILGSRITGCFLNCSSLTSVTINAPVTCSGYFLYNCSSLTSVTINAPVTCSGCFLSCASLASVTINAPVTCNNYFLNCASLASVTINAPVTCNNYFLYNCSSLTSVTINSDLICDSTYNKFYNCTNLRAIYIGTYGSIKITSATNNFYNCTELTDIYYIGTEEQCQENVDIEDGSQGNLANVTWHYKWTPGGGSEGSPNAGGTADGLEDVNIEIEGADWKALGWTDLIKITKITSDEEQPTITPQNPKFVLDFTDMWTAIYEDCANGNTSSGSTQYEMCMYEYDVHIDVDIGSYHTVMNFRLLEPNNNKLSDMTCRCYVNNIESTYDGEVDSINTLSLETLLAGVPKPIFATGGLFYDNDDKKIITGIWMQNNTVCVQYIGDVDMVADSLYVSSDMTNKSYVRLKSISMLSTDVK